MGKWRNHLTAIGNVQERRPMAHAETRELVSGEGYANTARDWDVPTNAAPTGNALKQTDHPQTAEAPLISAVVSSLAGEPQPSRTQPTGVLVPPARRSSSLKGTDHTD